MRVLCSIFYRRLNIFVMTIPGEQRNLLRAWKTDELRSLARSIVRWYTIILLHGVNGRSSTLSTAMSRLIWQISKVFRSSGDSNRQIPKLQFGPKCLLDKSIFEMLSSARSISKLQTAKSTNSAQTRNCQPLSCGIVPHLIYFLNYFTNMI